MTGGSAVLAANRPSPIMKFAVDAVEGTYWFDVLINDQLLTRVPLRVMYQRVPGGPSLSGSHG